MAKDERPYSRGLKTVPRSDVPPVKEGAKKEKKVTTKFGKTTRSRTPHEDEAAEAAVVIAEAEAEVAEEMTEVAAEAEAAGDTEGAQEAAEVATIAAEIAEEAIPDEAPGHTGFARAWWGD
jgi:hypothetical protein